WYLTEDEDAGQSPQQLHLIDEFRGALEQWAQEHGWKRTFIGADQFFQWVPDHPQVQVSPDVYLLDDVPQTGELPRTWQTWKPGVHPPRFAIEMVSVNDRHKDLTDAPDRYSSLGCRELVIFDLTRLQPGRRKKTPVFAVYR